MDIDGSPTWDDSEWDEEHWVSVVSGSYKKTSAIAPTDSAFLCAVAGVNFKVPPRVVKMRPVLGKSNPRKGSAD
jgi:hypothetical protein